MTKAARGDQEFVIGGYTEMDTDDRLRQPVFLGIREDKNANEVVREKAS